MRELAHVKNPKLVGVWQG